jgi:endonuclease G
MSPQLRWLLLLGVAVLQACSTVGGVKPRGHAVSGSLNPEQRALANASCFGGIPSESQKAWGPTELIFRQGYVLEHSSLGKIPLWVCEHVTAEQLKGHLARNNKFLADPDLKGPKALPNDYARSGYDRGHQAPAGNQTTDERLKAQTFFMSNMAPQRPSLNRGIWRQLEEKTRRWVRRYGQAYEWTGPILCVRTSAASLPDTFPCRVETIGANKVVVPLFFYKIILVEDHSTWRSIAYVLPNADFKAPYRVDEFITSIDSIERRTGINFMPDADPAVQTATKHGVSSPWDN